MQAGCYVLHIYCDGACRKPDGESRTSAEYTAETAGGARWKARKDGWQVKAGGLGGPDLCRKCKSRSRAVDPSSGAAAEEGADKDRPARGLGVEEILDHLKSQQRGAALVSRKVGGYDLDGYARARDTAELLGKVIEWIESRLRGGAVAAGDAEEVPCPRCQGDLVPFAYPDLISGDYYCVRCYGSGKCVWYRYELDLIAGHGDEGRRPA